MREQTTFGAFARSRVQASASAWNTDRDEENVLAETLATTRTFGDDVETRFEVVKAARQAPSSRSGETSRTEIFFAAQAGSTRFGMKRSFANGDEKPAFDPQLPHAVRR